jgi:hypothetical protein
VQGRAIIASALDTLDARRVRFISSPEHTFDSARSVEVSKRYDHEVEVERDAGMPSAFRWRGRHWLVADVIGRWRIEGRWWAEGRDREYWRVEARGGAVFDLYHDRLAGRWHLERVWD